MKISIASAVATLLGSIPAGYLGGVTGIAVWLAIHNAVLFLPWGWALYRTSRDHVYHVQS
jgi:O-antigen/teichoic acid export membrane protein